MNTSQEKLSATNKTRFIAFLILIAAFLVLGKIFAFDIDSFRDFMARFPPYIAWPLYTIVYVTIPFFIWIGPKDIFRVAAAVAWGPYISTLLVFIGEMINVFIF